MTKYLIQRWVLATREVAGLALAYRLIYRTVSRLVATIISTLPAVKKWELIRGDKDTEFTVGLSDLDFVAVLSPENRSDYFKTVRTLGRLNSYLPRCVPLFQFCFSIEERDLSVPAFSQWIGIHHPGALRALGHSVSAEHEGARRIVALRSAYRWFFEYYYPNATSTPRIAATIRSENRRYFKILRDLYFGVGRCGADVFSEEAQFSAAQVVWAKQLGLELPPPLPVGEYQGYFLGPSCFRALWNEFHAVSVQLVWGNSSRPFSDAPSFPSPSLEMRSVFGYLLPKASPENPPPLNGAVPAISKWIRTYDCLQSARDFRESLVDSKETLLDIVFNRVPRTLQWVRKGIFDFPAGEIPPAAFSLSKWQIYRTYYEMVSNSHRELLDYIREHDEDWRNLPLLVREDVPKAKGMRGPLRDLVSVLVMVFTVCGRAAVTPSPKALETDRARPSASGWQKPPEILSRIDEIPDANQRERVRYGKELFVRTAFYLGPKGKVAHHTNRMNCQNCHLDAGLKKYGNDLLHASPRYPMYRAREGRVLSLKERINNCVERPLNGKALPVEGREMEALHAYISWLSTLPLARDRIAGENLIPVTYPARAADPKRGAKLFRQHCARCHGTKGEGILHSDEIAFAYPPLWGPESFNAGSSMSRVTMLAAFIRANMPYGVTWDRPVLSNDQAFDVAAFVTSPNHTRPALFNPAKDYPNIADKPVDLTIGPYGDPFSLEQHWLGPFQPIADYYRSRKAAATK